MVRTVYIICVYNAGLVATDVPGAVAAAAAAFFFEDARGLTSPCSVSPCVLPPTAPASGLGLDRAPPERLRRPPEKVARFGRREAPAKTSKISFC